MPESWKNAVARFARRVRPGVLVVAVALAALGFGAGTTCRLWLHLSGSWIAENPHDAILHLWWLGHTPAAIVAGGSPFVADDLNWPEGVSAMVNTSVLLPGLLLAPVTWLAGPLATLNLLTVLAVPACAAGGYWALRRLPIGEGARVGIGRAAALVGATAFAISPAVVNSLDGHISMAFAPGLPVLITLSVRAWHSERPIRTGLALGLVAAAQLFTGEEVLFQAGLAAGLVLLVAAASRPRAIAAAAPRLGTALAAAFVVFLPLAGYPLYLQFLGPRKVSGSPFLPDFFGADLTSFTTATSRLLLHSAAQASASAKFPGQIEEHLSYLGWPLLLTCLVTAVLGWRRVPVRCAAVLMLTAMLLSLGGRIWIHGVWTEHPGPYRLLQRLPIGASSLATRFGLLAALAAAALLAFAVQSLATAHPRLSPELTAARPLLGAAFTSARPWLGGAFAAALSLACLLPLVPEPVEVAVAPAVPKYFTSHFKDVAANRPDTPVVLVLPFPNGQDPTGMRWQAAAGYRFRMPGGYFIGPAENGRAFMGGSLDPPTALLLQAVARTGHPVTPTSHERAQAIRDLTAWGVSQVVIGPDPARQALLVTVSGLLQRAPEFIDGVAVWQFNPGN